MQGRWRPPQAMPSPFPARSASSLLSANIGQHTVERLYAEHGPQRPWAYWLVLSGVIGTLVSLPLIKVNASVRVAGLVRPATEHTEVRPAVSGQIEEVPTGDNDRVSARPAVAGAPFPRPGGALVAQSDAPDRARPVSRPA